VQCNRRTQVLLSHEFFTTDNTRALPSVESQRLILEGAIPNGVEVTAIGEPNRSYTLTVTGVCCDPS
jgi:hypothetical protein